MNNYNKNFKGHRWPMTRRITTRLINRFKRDVILHGRNAWKRFANPNGPYSPIKRRIISHNQKVREAWATGKFNKREKVIEIFGFLPGNSLKLQHVDNEHTVREKVFLSKIINPEHMEQGEIRIFGDSELPRDVLDTFNFLGLDYASFCQVIDLINSLA